jgi:LytS/YehU family sensor histidine kinase
MIKVDKYRILQHILFWSVLIAFNVLVYGYGYQNYKTPTISLLLTLPIDIIATYFTLYFLTPRFLYKKQYVSFVFLLLISAIVFSIGERYMYRFHVIPIISPGSKEALNPTLNLFNPSFFILVRNIYYVVFLALGLKLLKNWYRHEQEKKDLKNQSLHSELAMLKQQISPHFLFNTLNNIDTLIHKNQAKASESIMQLSEIMRYMLYETNSDKVPLQLEIKYIQSYIDLFKLSIKNQNFIRFAIEGNPANKFIAPMIFVPFIENAFKHGNKNIEENPGIDIKLIIKDNSLTYMVENHKRKESDTQDKTSGIGLKNVKRRLDLIYGEKHELTINDKAGKFLIKLDLNIE